MSLRSDSTSRPGQKSFENVHTGERVSWRPTEAASAERGRVDAPAGFHIVDSRGRVVVPAAAAKEAAFAAGLAAAAAAADPLRAGYILERGAQAAALPTAAHDALHQLGDV